MTRYYVWPMTTRTWAVWCYRFGNPSVRFTIEKLKYFQVNKRDVPWLLWRYRGMGGGWWVGVTDRGMGVGVGVGGVTCLSIWTSHDMLDVNTVSSALQFRYYLFCVHQDSRTDVWWWDFCFISDNYFRNVGTETPFAGILIAYVDENLQVNCLETH